MPKLLNVITNLADGSVEGLRRVLDNKTLPLLQAISDLDKVKELCWDEESLRALLHGATNELLRSDRSDNDDALLKESATLLQLLKIAPFGAVIFQENCAVIPFLTKIQSRKVQRELSQMIGEAGQSPAQHKDGLLAGLKKAAETASSVGILSHLAQCFKLAGFQSGLLLDYLTTAVERLGRKGFNNLPAIWREVKKCLALGVPEAVDPLLQNFRALGSERRFTGGAPAEVTLYLIGAADRLDAPELNEKISTDAFKQLEADQLIISLPTTKDPALKNKILAAILDKEIDKVDLSASLMLLQAADELHQLKVLVEKAESVLIKAIHQDTLVECILVLQTLATAKIQATDKVCTKTAEQILKLTQTMSAASLGDHLLDLRAGVRLLHQQGALPRLPDFIKSLSQAEPLREIARSAQCNDLAIAQLLSCLLRPWSAASKQNREIIPQEPLQLAEILCGVPQSQLNHFPSPRLVYDLLIRVVGGSNEQVRAILAGLYKVVGMRGTCPVYERAMPVVKNQSKTQIYFWAEDNKWYIGPHDDTNLVYAYAMKTKDPKLAKQPPRRNWHWQGSSTQNFQIKAFCLEDGSTTPSETNRREPVPEPAEPPKKKRQEVPEPAEPPKEKSQEVTPPSVPPKRAPHGVGWKANKVPKTSAPSGPRSTPEIASSASSAQGKKPAEPPAPPMKGASSFKGPPAGLNEAQMACWEWLMNFDKTGHFTQYFEKLNEHFDADLETVKWVKFTPGSGLETIEENFWTCCGITKMGHKLLFLQNIAALGGEKI